MPSVLIVDDLLSIHEMLDAVIQPTGFSTSFATDGEKGLTRFRAEKPDLVLADIDMKPVDGITLLRNIRQLDPNAVVIIMTAYASTETALQALKLGAFDYLPKPFRVDELIATLRRGLEFKQIALADAQVSPAQAPSGDRRLEDRLVGSSPRFLKVIQQVKKLCTVRSPALLQGEPGTGKNSIAEILHHHGPHPDARLVRVDCSLNQPDALRAGLLGPRGDGGTWVQEALQGTLYLHHLQCLPPDLQRDFVAVLRQAGNQFRLVATTTEDLERLTDEGKFCDELFYRVASLPVLLPPLRERSEDIPELISVISSQTTNPFFDTAQLEFTDDAIDVLRAYHWPGNITELHQVISKVAATVESRVVTSEQLPLRLKEVRTWPSLDDYLAGQRKLYIDNVLRACRGDSARAARVLGLPATALADPK